jgi:hypothetical protein
MSITKNCAIQFFSSSHNSLCNLLKIKDRVSKSLNFGPFLHTVFHKEQTSSVSNESLDLAQAIASLCA